MQARFKELFAAFAPGKAHHCPSCLAPVEVNASNCHVCGSRVRVGFLRSSGMRSPSAIAAVTLALVAGVAAAAYVALAKGPKVGAPARAGIPVPTTAAAPKTPPPRTKPKQGLAVRKAKTKTSAKTKGTAAAKGTVTTKSATTTSSSSGTTTTATTTPTSTTTTTTGTTTTSTTPTVAPGTITLGRGAVKTYNPSSAPAASFGSPADATDGNPLSSWTYKLDPSVAGVTSVGLGIALKSAEHLHSIMFETDTPGMAVSFYGAPGKPPASITDPGWAKLASDPNMPASSTISLHADGRKFDYVLVVITHAPPGVTIGTVDISEISLIG
jgi:hypothetical protein